VIAQPLVWILWIALAAIVTWKVAIFYRVFVIRRRYKEWAQGPIESWAPPGDVSFEPVALPVVDDPGVLSPDVDDQGVYVVDYDALGQRGTGGRQRNPANIAVFAIRRARRYLENRNETDLALAACQFRYLADTAHPLESGGMDAVVWRAEFDLGYQFNARAPWTSAYGQGYCVLALLWAHRLSGEAAYLDLAHRGLEALGIPVAKGGLSIETDGGGLFFEEVVCSPLHHILNGHMTTVINIHHFGEFTGSERARQLFGRGVQGTIDMLPRYDKHGYSLYSLSPNPGLRNHFNIANSWYHHKHIAQLRELHRITGEDTLRAYAADWDEKSRGFFDVFWIALRVVFKDLMRLGKSAGNVFARRRRSEGR
jgi:hypothetical protein